MTALPASTMWIDVDDLLHYLAHHPRPTGIQRVTFEMCHALHRLADGPQRVRFVRRAGGPRDIITVEWNDLDTFFRSVANPAADVAPLDDEPIAAPRGKVPVAAPPMTLLPPEAGAGALLTGALGSQAKALLVLAKLPVRAADEIAKARRRRQARKAAEQRGAERAAKAEAERAEKAEMQRRLMEGEPLKDTARPGDIFLVLGSPWTHRDYVDTVRWARDDLRMKFALLIYDLIPVRRPEWCHNGLISVFVDWHKSVMPLADQVFAISQATADDVTAWGHESRFNLGNTVQPVPMGTGLGHENVPLKPNAPPAADWPAPGSYVLFVSTLEARKNHALLFRVWRRLLAEMPRDKVPTLVFAGRVGWLVADLMQQLENAEWLDGKIRLLSGPTDAELMALYRGCQFTLFPSFHEGWGLPVSESLALGCPCIVSNRTSLPEAGGNLARYFDPDNLDDAYAVIRAVIDDPAGLKDWRARVAREFRHVSWDRSADVIVRALDALEPAGY